MILYGFPANGTYPEVSRHWYVYLITVIKVLWLWYIFRLLSVLSDFSIIRYGIIGVLLYCMKHVQVDLSIPLYLTPYSHKVKDLINFVER